MPVTRYNLTTLDDLLAVPLDKLPRCLDELVKILPGIAAAKQIGIQPIYPLVWTDEGNGDLTLTVTNPSGGQAIFKARGVLK